MLMKIQKSTRVEYKHNPLAEVICQARFVRIPSFENSPVLDERLQSLGYTSKFEPPVTLNINVVSPGEAAPEPSFVQAYGAASPDGIWNVTFSAESFALVCNKYTTWSDFLPRFLSIREAFVSSVGDLSYLRVGLRYKDLIDRDRLNLSGSRWDELIKPSFLGPLASGVFADDEAISETQVQGSLTHGIIQLNNCMMVLQSSLLRELEDQSKTVFLIDTDFFREFESPASVSKESLESLLIDLHESAGDMFRRAIQEKLHAALARE